MQVYETVDVSECSLATTVNARSTSSIFFSRDVPEDGLVTFHCPGCRKYHEIKFIDKRREVLRTGHITRCGDGVNPNFGCGMYLMVFLA